MCDIREKINKKYNQINIISISSSSRIENYAKSCARWINHASSFEFLSKQNLDILHQEIGDILNKLLTAQIIHGLVWSPSSCLHSTAVSLLMKYMTEIFERTTTRNEKKIMRGYVPPPPMMMVLILFTQI